MRPEREQILSTLRAHRAELRGLGVRSLALFGSVARGEATAGSDVDLLVDFDHPYSLFELCRTEEIIRDWTGFPVDLVPLAQLRPELREQVLREAILAA